MSELNSDSSLDAQDDSTEEHLEEEEEEVEINSKPDAEKVKIRRAIEEYLEKKRRKNSGLDDYNDELD